MFSVLMTSVLMISLSETHSAFADTPIDTTDYYGQALKIFNDQQKLVNEVKGFEQQISDLQLSNANTPTITSKISDLQKQVDVDNQQIDSDTKEIKRLEALNIKSYQVDPQTEMKLRAAEKAIHDKYFRDDTSSNPVQMVHANFKYRTIVVMLDQDQVGNKASPVGKIHDSKGKLQTIPLDAKSIQSVEPTGDVPVDIQFGQLRNTSCTSQFLPCTPLIAGVSVSNNAKYTPNTLGYKATVAGVPGFVIAGHTAKESLAIVQPYNQNRVIGTAMPGNPPCDCAFVPSSSTTPSTVFGQTQGSITAKVLSNYQQQGSFVYKMGAATGLSFGQITYHNLSDPYTVTVQANVGGGDSGSPVFVFNGLYNMSLYGMLYNAYFLPSGATAYNYTPWDWVQVSTGAIPLTP